MASPPSKLEVARREARRTLDQQSAAFDAVETKAIRVMRFDLALTTLLVSALSLVSRAGGLPDAGAFLNGYADAGLALVLASTVLAGVTYTVSVRYCGPGPDAIDAALGDGDGEAYRRRLVASYADWIRANHRLNRRVAMLSSAAILAVVFGVVGIVLGTATALGHPPSPLTLAGTGLVFFAALAASGLPRQLSRFLADRHSADPADRPGVAAATTALPGQQIFRGREQRDDRERRGGED